MEILLQTYLNFFKFSIIVIFIISPSSSFIDPLSQALLSLKSDLNDPSNTLNTWIFPHEEQNPPSKISACSWVGIKCNENSTKITSLDLSMKNLGGQFEFSPFEFSLFTDLLVLNISYNSFSQKLPIGIFNLTNLRVLDISRNNFSGNFPTGISSLKHLTVLDAFSNSFSGELPADVSELRSLQVLNFAGSYFSGPIPSTYGSLSSLEFIHLAGNFLTGKIPQELGELKSLTHMEIGYNSYEGTIPWQFGNMSELQYLDIAGANLSGSIPKELCNLTNLQTLFLFRNQISGLIPVEFSQIKNLTNLDLSDNLLTGPIPDSFSQLSNLKLLSLMYNYMNGSVPQEIANLPLLDTLLIWDNFFTGSLPENLGLNSNLKWVDVSTNNFVGFIPPNICSNGFLFKLILFSNQFSGGLYPSLSNCSSLVRLRIEDNSFSGQISLNFNQLADISYIDLSRNNFDGGIPNDIFKLSKLEYFNVSGNSNLGGLIPPRTWSLPVLQNFSASHCNITGEIPPLHSCKSLYVIELNGNRLSGAFPENVSDCHFLEKMNLANNNLTGHIPEEIASLSLRLLNLSFNDFSGSIPSEKIFKSMGSSSFEGNPSLCGVPLKPCHRGKEIANRLELGSKRTQKLAWVLILCGVVVLFITISVFGVFHFKKEEWKMVSFGGFPQFKATDVLRSFNSVESMESMPVFKAVLPTGITVLVRKIEWDSKKMGVMVEFIRKMGQMRHKNLNRLLGFCYNKNSAYFLCDYLPNGNLAEKIGVKRDWETKYKIVIGIAKGLCFLHHDCYPSIPHGDLKASNVVFDENTEPHLAEYGFKSLVQLNNCSFAPTISMMETGELNNAVKEELHADVYNFGEIILEILTNGRLKNGGVTIQNKPNEILVREICNENEADSSQSLQEEIKLVFEVSLLCTRNRPSDRPSMNDALKLLLGLKSGEK